MPNNNNNNNNNNAETIERLARQLEQQRFLNDIRNCQTMEDMQILRQKYEDICAKHDGNA